MKAKTIEDLYHYFQPENTITKETQDFYINIFEESLKRFSIDLANIQIPNTTYLIAGQSGNGKSSALNMLSINYPNITKKYDFKYIVGRKNFEYLPKIDVADILFNIAYSIIENNDTLHDKFVKDLTELEKIFNQELEKRITNTKNENEKLSLGAKIGVGAKILNLFESKIDFSTSYSLSDEAIESATEIFKFKKQELIKIINDLILDYKKLHKKELIIIIDDIEKRKDVNHLFISSNDNNAQLPILNDLNLIKIITMPIHIVRSNYVRFGKLKEFGLKLKKSDGENNTKDKELLKKVIYKRIDENTHNLIEDKAIEAVIENSGANMNQLVRLIHEAALECMVLESSTITEDEIIKVSADLQRELSPYVMNQRTFLNQIKTKNISIDDDTDLAKLEKAISNNIVFAYFNGETWFEVNPVCEKSLIFYNKKIDE